MIPDVEVVAFTATQIPGIADRRYPAELAGARYPAGIPIRPEVELETLDPRPGRRHGRVRLQRREPRDVMHAASRALAAGADFELLGPTRTMLASSRPVVAVCAVRTGCGKSQTTPLRCRLCSRPQGLKVAVVRHPMPYGDLVGAARPAIRDVRRPRPVRHHHRGARGVRAAPRRRAPRVRRRGLRGRSCAAAETEADVVLWDGGNNDLPFYRPDLLIVVVDPLRPGHELSYHPGETNLRHGRRRRDQQGRFRRRRRASPPCEADIRRSTRGAIVIEARSSLALEGGEIAGKHAWSWSRTARP